MSQEMVIWHVVDVVVGGPLFGIAMNLFVHKVLGHGDKPYARFLGTWFGTLPALLPAAAAAREPGLTPEEHTQRILNAVDALAASVQYAMQAAAQSPEPSKPPPASVAPPPKPAEPRPLAITTVPRP